MNTYIRLSFLAIVALASIYMGFFALEDSRALELFKLTAYHSIAITFALFVWFIFRGFPAKLSSIQGFFLRREILLGLVVSIFGTVFLLRSEPVGFKTIMDEHLIAATAKHMHEYRQAEVTTRAHTLNNALVPLAGFVDKRPVFYPFLTSMVSDLTGFRPKNGVYLNLCLTPVLLFLFYTLVLRLSNVCAAIAAVVLLCSAPLLGHVFAGGGLEPINLLFIIITCFLGGLYLEKPDVNRLGALCMSGILLAQCRYESVLFVPVVGLIIAWSWLRQRKISILWPLFLCPILLVPYLLQNRVFKTDASMWQMDDVAHADKPFSIDYMYDNLGRAVGFFFDFGHDVPNTWLLAALGSIALLLLLVRSARHLPRLNQAQPSMQSAVIFLVGFTMLFLLLLAYSWPFDSPITRRLSLPLHLPLAVATSYLFFISLRTKWVQRGFWLITAIYFLLYVFPVTSKRFYGQHSFSIADFEAAEDFLKEVPYDKFLVIADNATFFYLFGHDALSTDFANRRKKALKFYLNQPLSFPVFHYERPYYDPVQKKFFHSGKGLLDDAFVKEVYWERVLTPTRSVRFSRIVDVEGVELEPTDFESMHDYNKAWSENLP